MSYFATASIGHWFACMAAALSLISGARLAQAQTIYDWNDPAGGGYSDALNWTPLGVPDDPRESARFDIGGTFNVALGSGTTTTVGDLLVNDGNVTLASNAAVLATYVTDDDVVINKSVLTLSRTGGNGDVRLAAGDDLIVNNAGAFAVDSGSQMTTGDFELGTSGLGMTNLIGVDGAGSSFTRINRTPIAIGQNGATAELLFRNSAVGDINGTLSLAGSANDASAASLDVESEADLELESLNIGASGSSVVAHGDVTVTGSGSTITQTGDSTLTIGTAAGNIGNLNVVGGAFDTGGVFSTGTGLTTVNATGAINITRATFNANGDVDVNGGSITRLFGSFNLAAGRTLTAKDDAQIDLGSSTTLSGGTTWEISDGADLFTASAMDIGASGVTTMTVDGAGSSLISGSNSDWGYSGRTADVTVRNDASADVGTVFLANSTTAGTTGLLAVESGATMITGSLFVAAVGGVTTTGTITIDDAALTQTGGSALTLGHDSSGAATINVLNGGTFNTGGGLTTINATGSINIDSFGSTFNPGGDVNVNGGSITRDNNASFNLAAGRTFTASNNAQINFISGGATTLSGGTTWNITGGADLFSGGVFHLGITGGVTALTVDGAGSSLLAGDIFTSSWGAGGNTAQVTLRNGATAEVADVSLAQGIAAGTTGTITVESGATMIARTLFVAASGGVTTSGAITVTGAGSTLTQTGFNELRLGHATTGTAMLNVLDGGAFTAGSGGTVLHATGTINIDGGSADLGPLDRQGGAVNFVSGSLSYGGDLTVGPGGLLGSSVTLEGNQFLTLSGTTTINALNTLTLDGGSLSTAALAGDGQLAFNSGTLTITGPAGVTIGAGGPIGDRLELKPSAILAATNGISNQGLVTGHGTLIGTFTNAAAGEVRAEAGNTLFFDGAGHSNNGNVRLVGGWAEFGGTLTNNAGGNITGRGTLSTGGLANQGDLALSAGVTDVFGDVNNLATGRVLVSGHADVTFWDDVTHAGAQFNVSTGSSVTFFGTAGFGVSGGGDVFFEAEITPGSSPGLEQFGGNVHFGALANFEIEIAGITRGAEYDALDIAGTATLGGTLNVSLLNGFMLDEGDVFDVIAVGAVSGQFTGLGEGALVGNLGGKDLFITYAAGDGNDVALFTAGPAFSADFDDDGDVDGDDLVQWQGDFGPTGGSDADDDGDSDGADFLAWQQQLGSGVAPAASLSTAIPEPGEVAIVSLAAVAGSLVRRRGVGHGGRRSVG